jgi:hypothetical protein
MLGEEVEDFNVTEPTTVQSILDELGTGYKLKEGSGCFRKPYQMIHFENFSSVDEWVVIIPVEQTTVKLWKHTETGHTYVFHSDNVEEFVTSNCFDQSKWEINSFSVIEPGYAYFFRPRVWHSVEGGINHMFFIGKEE